MAMWAEIATPEQAKEIVRIHFHDTCSFNAPAGIRTLSPLEKMYNVRASGNPSSWQGPVWINVNYLVFRGLVKYGFTEEARELAERPFCFWDVTMNVSGHYMNIICLIMVSRY